MNIKRTIFIQNRQRSELNNPDYLKLSIKTLEIICTFSFIWIRQISRLTKSRLTKVYSISNQKVKKQIDHSKFKTTINETRQDTELKKNTKTIQNLKQS